MDENCIFCRIANNLTPSFKVYEDNDILAVLDIYPANIGQIIIFPKDHINDISYLDDGKIGKMFVLAKYLSIIIKEKIKCQGFNFIFYSGNIPGKRDDHIVLYVIPRFDNDNVKIISRGNIADSNILEELKNYIISKLGNIGQDNNKNKNIKQENKENNDKEINYDEMLKWLRKNI